MKIRGQILTGPAPQIIAFPRPSTFEDVLDDSGKPTGETREVNHDIIFSVKMIVDLDNFENILPPPQPPEVVKPGNVRFKNDKSPEFIKALDEWGNKRLNWMILRSLEDTEELEWDTVDMGDPDTWVNFRQELSDSGFNRVEIQTLINTALIANSIDEGKMEQARARFLRQQAEAAKSK